MIHRPTLHVWVLVSMLFPSIAIAQTGTAVCYATADTRLEQKAPTTNYGGATRVNADKLWATCASASVVGQLAEAALKFNLTDITACNLPAGAVINAVRLTVNVGDATVDRFGVYQLRKAWTELGATWSTTGTGAAWQLAGANGTTSPGQDRNTTLLASLSNQAVGLRKIPFNTAGRDAVRGWQGAPSTNHGVLLRPHVGDVTTSCDDHVWISSRETSARPRLEIDWSLVDTTAPTISNIVERPATASATIQWATNEGANGQVSYGTTTSYGSNTTVSAGGLTSHSHVLANLIAGQRYFYRITSKDAAGNAHTALGDFVTQTSGTGATFKIVAWNMQYGKGMITRDPAMSCPLAGMKSNAQCQIADNPLTPLVNEREEERKRSAWGVGLTQRYLNSASVLGDPEVIALLLTEVNNTTCFTQSDLMAVVRAVWPQATISTAHQDNWIVARWGFVRGTTNYAHRNIPPCGYRTIDAQGKPVPYASSYSEGIQWGHIYAQDPDPDRDGVLLANPRTLHVFNTHWPLSGTDASGNKFFCTGSAPLTRDFMNSPATGINLSAAPRILGGDLNAEDLVRAREDPSLCEPYGGIEGYNVLREAGLTDAFTAPGTSKATPTTDGSTGMVGRPTTETCYRNFSHNGLYKPYKRIDFQWWKGGTAPGQNLRVLDFELIGVEQFGNCTPSDHMGTKVRYQWF